MTAFEPEAIGNLVEGLDFHKFYFDNRKCFLSISYFQNGHTMRTLIVVVGIFYTVLLSGSTVDALQLSEYSEVFSQYSDSLGNDGVYRILLDALK